MRILLLAENYGGGFAGHQGYIILGYKLMSPGPGAQVKVKVNMAPLNKASSLPLLGATVFGCLTFPSVDRPSSPADVNINTLLTHDEDTAIDQPVP